MLYLIIADPVWHAATGSAWSASAYGDARMDHTAELIIRLREALELADESGEHRIAAEIALPLASLEDRVFSPPPSRDG
jgi:hypothetical protein